MLTFDFFDPECLKLFAFFPLFFHLIIISATFIACVERSERSTRVYYSQLPDQTPAPVASSTQVVQTPVATTPVYQQQPVQVQAVQPVQVQPVVVQQPPVVVVGTGYNGYGYGYGGYGGYGYRPYGGYGYNNCHRPSYGYNNNFHRPTHVHNVRRGC